METIINWQKGETLVLRIFIWHNFRKRHEKIKKKNQLYWKRAQMYYKKRLSTFLVQVRHEKSPENLCHATVNKSGEKDGSQ